MNILMGEDIYGNRHVRIEIGDYHILILNGKKCEYHTPFFASTFDKEDEDKFIASMKHLISLMENTTNE